jgi:hypothetical protein
VRTQTASMSTDDVQTRPTKEEEERSQGPKLRREALRADIELQVGVEFVETEMPQTSELPSSQECARRGQYL